MWKESLLNHVKRVKSHVHIFFKFIKKKLFLNLTTDSKVKTKNVFVKKYKKKYDLMVQMLRNVSLSNILIYSIYFPPRFDK